MNNFDEHFLRQLNFLDRSCKAFDEGHKDEAVRIAVALRVLLHDTNRSTSILHHMKAKQICLLSTAKLYPKQQLVNAAFVKFDINLNTHLNMVDCYATPFLNISERNEVVPFHTWWRKEKVIELNNGTDVMHRRDLICAAANKDGGAHVDEELEPIYDKTRLGAGLSIRLQYTGGAQSPQLAFANIHYASLRQIAYEVLNSPDIIRLKQQAEARLSVNN